MWRWYWLFGFLYRWLRPQNFLGFVCPWCGENINGSYMDRAYFRVKTSGRYAIPGEPTVYWVEGTQQCPRCHHVWPVADSS